MIPKSLLAVVPAHLGSYRHGDGRISAFVFDIVCEAFRKSVRETKLADEHWAEYAKQLLQDMTGGEPDETIVKRIISGFKRWPPLRAAPHERAMTS